jgi:hypothetical protein
MNGKLILYGGLVLLGSFAYQLLAEIPKYVLAGNMTAVALNSICYILFSGMVALGVIRLAKRAFWCGKEHTWVYHPAVYQKKNPEKIRWQPYTDCSVCFEHKDSFELEEARRKKVCPSCGASIPWS